MEELLNYLKNYFYKFMVEGNFIISENKIKIVGNFLQGQYIKIQGSVLNDGVYRINSITNKEIEVIGAENEEFEGIIYSLAIPKQLIELENEIKAYKDKNKPSSIISESFGGYSYTLAPSKDGTKASWKDIFKTELSPYRKMVDRVPSNIDIYSNTFNAPGEKVKEYFKLEPKEGFIITEQNCFIYDNFLRIHCHILTEDSSGFNSFQSYYIADVPQEIELSYQDILLNCAGKNYLSTQKYYEVPGVAILESKHEHDGVLTLAHHLHAGVSSFSNELLITATILLIQ